MNAPAQLAGLQRQVAALTAASRPLDLDPIALAIAAGLDPDGWQRNVLTSRAQRVLLNCSRQSGKSTVASVLAVHTALTEPAALVLLLSPSLRQSGELFKKCITAYGAAGRPVAPDAESALRLELENGSRIVSLPGKEGTIRGYSRVRLLITDEASRIPDELYLAVRPMLAVSGGRLLAMSTPFGKRGWWFEAWQNGGPGWERVKVTAYDCPRISAEFLAEERATMPAWFFDQEYLCEPQEDAGAVFRYEDIQAAVTPAVTPLFGRAG
jgi:hypothetical protein